MSKPAVYNFQIVRGDTFNEVWTFRDSAGLGIDLSAATILFEARNDADTTTTLISHNPTGGSTGDITFNIPSTDTILLTFTKAPYDLEVKYSDATIETIVRGTVELYRDIAST